MDMDGQCSLDREDEQFDVTVLPSQEVSRGPKFTSSIPSSQKPTELYKFLVSNIGDNERLTIKSFATFYQRFFERKFSHVKQFYVLKENGKSLGYGFVIFQNRKSAVKALNASEKLLTIDLAPVLGNNSQIPDRRTLQISPTQATLILIVHNFVRTRKEGKEREIEERQEIVTGLMSKKISRRQIPDAIHFNCCEIEKLSDEAIRLIMDQLKTFKDLASCESVCRRWNTIVKDVWSAMNYFYLTPFLISLNGSQRSARAFSILKKFPSLRELNIRGLSGIDQTLMDIVGECCPILERIFFGGTFLSHISLKRLAGYCSNLKIVDLSSCLQLTEQNLCGLLQVASGLESLSIRGHILVTGHCFENLYQLTKLDIRRCTRITHGSFIKLAKKCQFSLRELQAGPISRDILSLICSSFRNLHTFDLEDSSPISTISVKLIYTLENLIKLRIKSSLPLDLDDGKFIELMKRCKKLRAIHFLAIHNITDVGVSKIPSFCPEIEHLSIPFSQVTDESVEYLSQLKNLKTLMLENTRVTDDGVKNFLSKCSSTVSLNVKDKETIEQETADLYQW